MGGLLNGNLNGAKAIRQVHGGQIGSLALELSRLPAELSTMTDGAF